MEKLKLILCFSGDYRLLLTVYKYGDDINNNMQYLCGHLAVAETNPCSAIVSILGVDSATMSEETCTSCVLVTFFRFVVTLNLKPRVCA